MTSIDQSKNMSKNMSKNNSKNNSKNISRVDCAICTEEVSSSRMVKCPFCDFDACASCVEKFLLGIDDDRPRCMDNDCKKVWSFEFLASQFPPSFHNKKYRERRADIRLQREKSLMPGTQHLVILEKQDIKRQAQVSDVMDEIDMLRSLININYEKIKDINETYNYIAKEKNNDKTFTRSCPVDECRGFLSTALKCGTCDTYACKHCHLPKARQNDDDHKCDPDLVATVSLLATDTKQCPSCSTPIFKIQGCDQMYCTQCHTAFSWLHGTIEKGVIHNPHFYEFQRQQNNGHAPRVRGDVRCGGLPDLYEVLYAVDGVIDITDAHRLVSHIDRVEIPRYPNNVGDVDNSNLRVEYLMNRIDEKQLRSKLKQQMKKQEKDSEFNMILTMFTTTMTDLFNNLVRDPNNITTQLRAMSELRVYTNTSLSRIGYRFGNVYPFIDDKWKYWSNSKKYIDNLAQQKK